MATGPDHRGAADAPDEPLELSAPLALHESAHRCARADDADSCRPYHGLWQYLRLMGIGKTLSGQSAAYLAALADAAALWSAWPADRPVRVLISGCADYSALAHVLHVLQPGGRTLDIVALDLCQTPLWLNRWYARRQGVTITTACADVLTWQTDRRFDLILTSSFFGYFDTATRPRLFAQYARWLAPGGWLVFANRLRDGPEDVATGFSDAAAVEFAARVAQGCAGLPSTSHLDADTARALALAYARNFRSFPLASAASVRSLADTAGLQVMRADRLDSQPLQAGLQGPSVGDGAPYLFVVATKPAAT